MAVYSSLELSCLLLTVPLLLLLRLCCCNKYQGVGVYFVIFKALLFLLSLALLPLSLSLYSRHHHQIPQTVVLFLILQLGILAALLVTNLNTLCNRFTESAHIVRLEKDYSNAFDPQ